MGAASRPPVVVLALSAPTLRVEPSVMGVTAVLQRDAAAVAPELRVLEQDVTLKFNCSTIDPLSEHGEDFRYARK